MLAPGACRSLRSRRARSERRVRASRAVAPACRGSIRCPRPAGSWPCPPILARVLVMACGDDVGTAPLIGLLPAAAEDSCQFVSRESRFLRLDVGRRSAAWPAGPLRTRQMSAPLRFRGFPHTNAPRKQKVEACQIRARRARHAAPSTRICLTPLTIIHKTLPCLNANHGIGSPSRHGTAVRLNRPAVNALLGCPGSWFLGTRRTKWA